MRNLFQEVARGINKVDMMSKSESGMGKHTTQNSWVILEVFPIVEQQLT